MRLILLSTFTLLFSIASTVIADQPETKPVNIIFDTDMGNDVDDVVALCMLHALQSRNECRLLAVTVSKDHDLAGPFVNAVNTFYGRGHIPVGVVHDGPTRDGGKYLSLADSYPRTLRHGNDAIEAVALLRQILSKQSDHSIVIIQVGFSTNLARLLDSPADAASPLVGSELVRKKVTLLSTMAGNFSEHSEPEYNVVNDIPSAKTVFETWPTPIVFSDFTVGLEVTYPSLSILEDYTYCDHHPLVEAYKLYNPPPHNRPCWDPTAVLYAVRPNRGYFGLSATGLVAVKKDGHTQFTPSTDGNRRFLRINHDQAIRATEAIVELASQPPDTVRAH